MPTHLRKLSFFALCLASCHTLCAQIGGDNIYEFLNLPPSARAAALGGAQLAVPDGDLGLAAYNPALYNEEADTRLSVNTAAYLAGINHGYAAFAKHFPCVMTAGIGIQYVAYGSFVQTDETGQVTGEFSGGEYAVNIGGARQHGRFSYGANMRFIASHLGGYNSFGLAADLGGLYHHPKSETSLAVVVKNLGAQLSTYAGTREDMPFEIQLGFSKKLKYLPFRINILAHNLQTWDIRYDDPTQQTGNIFDEGGNDGSKKHIADKFFRHLAFGGELYAGKALKLRVGYNHLRRKELSTQARGSLAGLSFGAGIHIKKIQFDYAFVSYHLGAGAHQFGLGTKFSDWKKPAQNEPENME